MSDTIKTYDKTYTEFVNKKNKVLKDIANTPIPKAPEIQTSCEQSMPNHHEQPINEPSESPRTPNEGSKNKMPPAPPRRNVPPPPPRRGPPPPKRG